MPALKKHTIDSLTVWLDKPAIQQAFTSLVAPIIEAGATAKTYGEEAAQKAYGDEEDSRYYPKAGEVEIGTAGDLVIKIIVEPRSGSWSGQNLTHKPINAIGIANMMIDGQPLKPTKQGDA